MAPTTTLPRVTDERRRAAFQEFVLPELAVMLRVARRLTGDAHRAEDLVQDALVRAYRALDRFDGRYPRAWLLTILRNTHLNTVRRRRPDLLDDEVTQRLPGRGSTGRTDGVADDAFAEELDDVVRGALGRLGRNQRAVIALVDLDGLSYREAAQILDIPVGTVMSRLHRARAKLRVELEDAGFDAHGAPVVDGGAPPVGERGSPVGDGAAPGGDRAAPVGDRAAPVGDEEEAR